MSLNIDQQRAYSACTNNPSPITIIQGKAGSGKSYLVEQILRSLPDAVILTPTNMAKSVYRSAQTYHSFFYGEFDDLDEGYMDARHYRYKRNPYFERRIQGIRTIILDEISMVRSDYMEMMNVVCKAAKNSNRPFGGINVICVGDMYQLPPVVDDENTLKYLLREYGGVYYFNSHVIQNNIAGITYCELTQSVRQQEDREYERILDDFRSGCEIDRMILDLDRINSRVVSAIPYGVPTIASSNSEVQNINHRELSKLSGGEQVFPATICIRQKGTENQYRTIQSHQNLKQLADCYPIEIPSSFESELHLKPGSLVMFTSSNKRSGTYGYINGDLGTVVSIDGYCDRIMVRHNKSLETHIISKIDKYRYEMRYDEGSHNLSRVAHYVQKTTQYPIKLAYAFTVHKSQGQTYDKIYFDLESPVFAAGQLYVALSRAKSLQGLFLTKPVSLGDVIVDPSIGEFFSRFNSTYSSGNKFSLPYKVQSEKLNKLYQLVIIKDADVVAHKVAHQIFAISDYLIQLSVNKYALIELSKFLSFTLFRFSISYSDTFIVNQIQQKLNNWNQVANVNEIWNVVDDFITLYSNLSTSDMKVSLENLHAL